MRHKPFFKLLCTLILLVYGSVSAQAGQVITKEDRDWARKALSQEAQLGDIGSAKSVAVLNFHNLTAQQQFDALQKGLAFMLITDLSKIEDLTVLERIKIQALLDEMALGETGLVDTATAPKVGKLLKAYYVVNGDIQEGAIGEIELGSYLLDVPFESITDLAPANGSLDELFRMEKEILFNIIDQLSPYISAEKRLELEKPLSISAAALLALFLGLDYSDKGMYKKAAEMYSQASAEDPGLEVARDSLQELKDMGLTGDKDLTRVEPSPEEVAAEGGPGLGTAGAVVGIGLIAGVAALALSSSSSDDKDGGGEIVDPVDPVEPVEPNGSTGSIIGVVQVLDTSPPDVSVGGGMSSINCFGSNTVNFNFTEPINTSTGSIAVEPGFFSNISTSWNTNNTQLALTLSSGPNDQCFIPGESTRILTFTISLVGYQDAASNPMPLRQFSFEAIPRGIF